MKQVLGTYSPPPGHWVGDGFPVRSLFSYSSHGAHVSPFLLLDYAGPAEFTPAGRRRGVGEHPHRGFETVTIVYHGEVAHLDTTGAGGLIGPGDVQWMTAAAGIQHQEFHSEAFTRRGGVLEMVQLWVNLPARDKMSAPGYQTLLARDIPVVALPGDAGQLRVIAGEVFGARGPARTHTPMGVWDLRLRQGCSVELPLPTGWTALVVLLKGALRVNGTHPLREAEFALLDLQGTNALLEAESEVTALVLTGEPIDEPIAGYGPFVMNTEAEIRQAITDFRSGRFGRLAS
jgi:quercetin 2,3-dioxygenase